MLPTHLTSFTYENRRLLKILGLCSLLWSFLVYCAWWLGRFVSEASYWGLVWLAFQLFAAAQVLVAVQLLNPENRLRSFYWFWAFFLVAGNLCLHWFSLFWGPFPGLQALRSGMLLLTGTLVGAVLARYINRAWELVLICVVMSLADFSSWLAGPTAQFARQITAYYTAPEGPPPLIDSVLIKFAFPGHSMLIPVFGVSDWVMVTFFTCVAGRFRIKENLFGPPGYQQQTVLALLGRYLPVPVVVLFSVILAAHAADLFIPVLPVLAVAMLCWYLAVSLWRRKQH